MRMRSTWLAGTALALAALGCGSTRQPPPATTVVSGTLRVRDAAGVAGPFHLADLQRLFVDSTYVGVPGPHAERVDVVDPSGNTFGQLASDLAAGADGVGAATHRLEVRGTPIHMYHLVGSWRFVLTVDGTQLASASVDIVD